MNTYSPIEDLNNALQKHNPFDKPVSANVKDVWGKGFPDIETLNAHASDAVFHSLTHIHAGHYSVTSIVVTAETGTGKTHLIGRIRHRLQDQGGALFVYVNDMLEIKQIKSSFQKILAVSLNQMGSCGVTQWQELATQMANQAIKFVKPAANSFSPTSLVNKINCKSPSEFSSLVTNLTSAFRKAKNVSDPDIVSAIFWTLSEHQADYTSKWLGGDSIAHFKADELGLPTQNQSFDAVLQILSLISEYNELVICFDELDHKEFDDEGFKRAQAVANFIKNLFQNLKRGVIFSVMMPDAWQNQVKALPPGVWEKVSAHGKPIELNYMKEDSIIELVTLWLSEFYKSYNLVPQNPIYPFTENQLREVSKSKPTVRQALNWCKENCSSTKTDPVELAFEKELGVDLSIFWDDNYLIANILFSSFQSLIGKTIEKVVIESVTDKVKITGKGGKDPYLNFKIIGKEDGKTVVIGVAVLQDNGGNALGAGFKRLVNYSMFGLTRGCLVRSKSKDKEISKYLDTKYLTPLIGLGGEFVELKEDEIKPLAAIYAVYRKHKTDYQLTEEEIQKFINDKGSDKNLGISNSLLKEILSAPSYLVPVGVVAKESTTAPKLVETDDVNANQAIDSFMSIN
jgi:Cdc6-like AAA superfamily ATPase